jgi:hypothetical protein
MSSRRGRWIKIGTLLLAFVGLGACIAPILSVPPPGAMQISFESQVDTDVDGGQTTFWTTEGGPLPQAALATYYVRNRRLEAGVFAPAGEDGSFKAQPMEGTAGDPIQIYYVTPAGDYSESICVLLMPGAASAASLCPP